jgi:hypothetical protein
MAAETGFAAGSNDFCNGFPAHFSASHFLKLL